MAWKRSAAKVKRRLTIVSWYGRKSVEEICRFFNISKSWFYRLPNTFLREGVKRLLKKTGRPRDPAIPEGVVQEIRWVKQANPRIGSRRLKWLLDLSFHHTTIHRLLRAVGLVNDRHYKRRVWKPLRVEAPNQR